MIRLCKINLLFLSSITLLTSACSSPSQSLTEQGSTVIIHPYGTAENDRCIWKGEVIGSEGHWYTALFYGNDILTRGALNDIKNQAVRLEANNVFLSSANDFASSVTLFGVAYDCS